MRVPVRNLFQARVRMEEGWSSVGASDGIGVASLNSDFPSCIGNRMTQKDFKNIYIVVPKFCPQLPINLIDQKRRSEIGTF